MSGQVYDYDGKVRSLRRVIGRLDRSSLALSFLDHLGALGLSKARIMKYACHLPTILRVLGNVKLKTLTKKDVEEVASWINSQNYRGVDKV